MATWFHRYISFIGLFFCVLSITAQEKLIINPLPVNTEESEYGAVYYEDGIVFCKVNSSNELLTYVDLETDKPFVDLYFTKQDSYSKNKRAKLFTRDLKTSFHDGPITFSQDQKTAYFSRSRDVKRRLRNSTKTKKLIGIYRSDFDGKNWSKPQLCIFNSDEYNIGQPSLSPDGKKLYVVSDKPGGYGMGDIYYSELRDDGWSELINLGEGVNSDANEVFPFIDAAGKLFFSSDRAGGAGGFDFYKAIDQGGYWKENRLQDTILNTKHNDFSLVWDVDGRNGLFSSNRNGGDDIYSIKIEYPEFKECEELLEQAFCYEFFEESTVDLDSVPLRYQWDFGDGNKEEGLETFHCYDEPGFYIVELNVMDTIISKEFLNETSFELEIEEVIQPLVDCPDSVFLGETFTVDVSQGRWVDYTIQSTFIDFGDSAVVKGDIEPHSYNSIGQKELKVLIAGKDAETGAWVTNCFYKMINVIEKQFEGQLIDVYDDGEGYSIKDISADSIETGYYNLELLTSPTSLMGDKTIFKDYADGVKETFDEHRQTYSYSVGKTKSPLDLLNAFNRAHELGFSEAKVKFNGTKENVEVIDIKVTNTKGEDNTTVIFKDILFNFDSYSLKPESKRELDRLAEYLRRNKKVKVEIEAHTDNVGKSTYNQLLSERRAKSVFNYLVSTKKIKRQIIDTKSYGEEQPIATNKTRKGRARNRRASLKILKL